VDSEIDESKLPQRGASEVGERPGREPARSNGHRPVSASPPDRRLEAGRRREAIRLFLPDRRRVDTHFLRR
jgi:hypothetical protein